MTESQLKEAITCDDDIISSLPEYIREKFLVHLPIKEAVRTCILSKDWRYTWSTIPDLVVDVGKSSNSDQFVADDENTKIIRFIDQLLARHNGNIHKFKTYGIKYSRMDFHNLMLTLSKKYTSEIIIQGANANGKKPFTHDHFYTWPNLKVVALSCCVLFVPIEINFNGFKLLHTLELRDCVIIESDLVELISGCPLLEQLTFFQSIIFYWDIKICAPNLQEVTICCCFRYLSLQTPKLMKANFAKPRNMEGVRTSYLIQSLGSLSHVQSLGFHCDFFILLQPVKPSSYSSVYKEVESHQDGFFENLRDVNITPNIGSESVLEFANFILTNAPVLERLTIRGQIEDYVASKLKKHKNLSKTTEVIFDESCFKGDDEFHDFCL